MGVLERHLWPGTLSWRHVEGALYLWSRLANPDLDSSRLHDEAARVGVYPRMGRYHERETRSAPHSL